MKRSVKISRSIKRQYKADFLRIHHLIIPVFIMILTISVFSCSNEDDDIPSCETFLECNDNTLWKYEEHSNYQYIRFYNNQLNPIEFWIFTDAHYDDWCWWNVNFQINTAFEIIENSPMKFVIKHDIINDGDIDDGEYAIWTITLEGEHKLKISYKWYDNDIEIRSGYIYFNKKFRSIENLDICG